MNQQTVFLQSLPVLQAFLKENTDELEAIIQQAHNLNPWFIPEFTRLAFYAITEAFLDEEMARKWISCYPSVHEQKKVAVIMAGNLPLVGFHDLLCVLASGHQAIIKCSEKDAVLLPWLTDQWLRLFPQLSSCILYTQRFEDFDAAIATGSNNSSRYFEYYFRDYPHILRKNRNGVAVLTGNENIEDLRLLANDVFQYFGMGCRNVSKVYVPEGYDFTLWKEAISSWEYLADNNKYKNNLDYNFAIYIINQIPHIQLNHLILKEDESIASRIGCLHYSYYPDVSSLEHMLSERKEEIQCVVSGAPLAGWDHVNFGQSQHPRLDQYADGIDTMAFLSKL